MIPPTKNINEASSLSYKTFSITIPGLVSIISDSGARLLIGGYLHINKNKADDMTYTIQLVTK